MGGGGQLGLLMESEEIIPKVYERVRKHPDYIRQRLTALFTHKKEFLDLFPNTRFCPAYSVWYGTEKWGGEIRDEQVKTKMVSFVGCDKAFTQLHLFRQEVTRHYHGSALVDVYGKAVGRFASCDEIFTSYRYNIAIENGRYDYYFTEKILNCFASKTVPVYYGCLGIGKFFNTDGIIVIEEPTLEAVERALAQCSEADYERRSAAIDDNFRCVKEFLCVEDYLTANYPELFGLN